MKFTADLHTHTRFSKDCLSEPDEVIAAAVKKRLSAMAITDHDEVDGAFEAARLAKEKNLPLQVIVGEEVGTDKGDLLVYFLKRRIAPGTLARVLSEVNEQKAVCCAAHPYDAKRNGIALGKLPAAELARIDAIEALNARATFASFNDSALLFAQRNRKPVLAGSDAHHPSEIGAAFVEFEGVGKLNAKNILTAKRELRGKLSSPLVHAYSRYAVLRKRLGLK